MPNASGATWPFSLAAVSSLLSRGELPTLLALFVLSATFGALDAVRMVATQALVYDLAGRDRGLAAISLANLSAHLVGITAGLAGGALLAGFGFGIALASIAVAQSASAAALLTQGHVRSRTRAAFRISADPLAPAPPANFASFLGQGWATCS